MRGEHPGLRPQALEGAGIIPACAGSTRMEAGKRTKAEGIIPACAGSTHRLLLSNLNRMGSSPHARGAPSACRPCARSSGDHPRMRGEHLEAGREHPVDGGIIPACAGSTVTPSTLTPCLMGSSPHARGARKSCNNRRT